MKQGDRIRILKDLRPNGISPKKGEIYFIVINNDPEFISFENTERKQQYMLNKNLLGDVFEIIPQAYEAK
jgi:hypothetical protein